MLTCERPADLTVPGWGERDGLVSAVQGGVSVRDDCEDWWRMIYMNVVPGERFARDGVVEAAVFV